MILSAFGDAFGYVFGFLAAVAAFVAAVVVALVFVAKANRQRPGSQVTEIEEHLTLEEQARPRELGDGTDRSPALPPVTLELTKVYCSDCEDVVGLLPLRWWVCGNDEAADLVCERGHITATVYRPARRAPSGEGAGA